MVSEVRSYCIPSQYLALVAPPNTDYAYSMILVNNMDGSEITRTENAYQPLVEWLSGNFGTLPSDYYFIGSKNYLESEKGYKEGSWDLYEGIDGNIVMVNTDMTTGGMEENKEAIFRGEYDRSGAAPFIYIIYRLKEKPVKMPNIRSTYGNPYEVFAIDFCSIESTSKR